MSQFIRVQTSLVLMEDLKPLSDKKDVIIKGNATVNGGITCGECVETNTLNVVLLIASVLKVIMLLTELKYEADKSEIHIYN